MRVQSLPSVQIVRNSIQNAKINLNCEPGFFKSVEKDHVHAHIRKKQFDPIKGNIVKHHKNPQYVLVKNYNAADPN